MSVNCDSFFFFYNHGVNFSFSEDKFYAYRGFSRNLFLDLHRLKEFSYERAL